MAPPKRLRWLRFIGWYKKASGQATRVRFLDKALHLAFVRFEFYSIAYEIS
jgi:hypothetical protein